MLCGKGNTSESKYEDALSVLGKTPNVDNMNETFAEM